MSPRTPSWKRTENALRKFALAFPETTEDHPWGDIAFKVRKKAFVFMGFDQGTLNMSVKLPASGGAALILPFTSPTGYGLGKSGWVTARFEPGEDVPIPILTQWIEESYRTIAPRKLVRLLEEATP